MPPQATIPKSRGRDSRGAATDSRYLRRVRTGARDADSHRTSRGAQSLAARRLATLSVAADGERPGGAILDRFAQAGRMTARKPLNTEMF